MKKIIFSFVVALLATVSVNAQQIAVVKGGATKLYNTLKDAFEGAEDGSVVYLPGGTFPIADSVKITKKLTIIGISHNAASDNADGASTISGHLFFNGGSDGSTVMGCYITGTVNIGEKEESVNRILVKYCNINAIQVLNANCLETEINQNYIRRNADFGKSSAKVSNNILFSVSGLNGGSLINNIVTKNDGNNGTAIGANNATISGNVVILTPQSTYGISINIYGGSNCQIFDNMTRSNWGTDCIVVSESWSKVFENPAGVSVNSKYHFINDYKQYEDKIGIYAGTGFSDGALPPIPYINECKVDEQTDAEGKLNIRIKVKAVTE